MSENFPLFDPRVNLALMSFTRFEASHDVTIFTINSRYAINTRTWINRSVFALASPVASPGRGNRSRINIRVSFVCIMQMRPCARNILHDGGEKLSDFSLDLPIHHLASSIFVPDRFVYSPLCFSIIRFILSPPFFLIALRIRRSDDNVSEIFLSCFNFEIYFVNLHEAQLYNFFGYDV